MRNVRKVAQIGMWGMVCLAECDDIELDCDEAAIRHLSTAEYVVCGHTT